jgi:hypothetical protein
MTLSALSQVNLLMISSIEAKNIRLMAAGPPFGSGGSKAARI